MRLALRLAADGAGSRRSDGRVAFANPGWKGEQLGFICHVVAVVAFTLVTSASHAADPAPVEVMIRALPDQMRYDVTEFTVTAGAAVRLTLRNDDFMPHNLVLCLPRGRVMPGAAEDNGMEVAVAAWTLGERADAMQWVPDHPRVITATKTLTAQTSGVIEFRAPTEPGRYPYVCTFPGHAASMFGLMQVQPNVEGLRALRYRLYRGPFAALPEFSTLSERLIEEGSIADARIDGAVGAPEESFAVEFEGTLPVARGGRHTFTVAGDNGPVLLIDGKVVVDHRSGNSWERSASGAAVLDAGEHRLVLQYWHRRDRRKPSPEVTLLWSGPGFKDAALSRLDLIERRRKQEAERATGMPIGPTNGEPVLYRNYLAGALPSGFGVGYPGGSNLTWDPVRMNVGSLWAGAFLDVKRHRTQRGGTVKPMGFAVVETGEGVPFAFLSDEVAEWPGNEAGTSGYRFLGYTLDGQRRPTFRYRFKDIVVNETFVPHGSVAEKNLRLMRHLVLTAEKVPAGQMRFRVLRASDLVEENGGYRLQNVMTVTPSSQARLRQSAGKTELLLPVEFRAGRTELQITYAWHLHEHH